MKTEKNQNNKNLYAIGFEHFNPINIENETEKPCKKIECNTLILADLIKIIGEKQKITRFFSDGFDKNVVRDIRCIVDHLASLDDNTMKSFIEKMIINLPQYGEDPRIYQNLAYLKKEGIDIKICQTEIDNFEKPLNVLERAIEEDLISEEYIKSLFGANIQKTKSLIVQLRNKLKKFNLDEFEFLINNLEGKQFRALINLRDKYMYKNFLKYSDKENLLIVGKAHALDPFTRNNKINYYRTDILMKGTDYRPKDISLKGKLPFTLKSLIDGYLDKKQIINKIDYKE